MGFHRQQTMWLWRNPDNVTHRQLLSIDEVWRRSTALTWSRWGCRQLADNIWLLAHDNNNNWAKSTHYDVESKYRDPHISAPFCPWTTVWKPLALSSTMMSCWCILKNTLISLHFNFTHFCSLTFWQLEPVFHKWVYERRYPTVCAASDKY